MKRSLLSVFLFLLLFGHSFAQAPFNTADSVNINNINARVLVHGDMFWDPATGLAGCEFPKGSGKNMNFASALWMSGYDASGQLHVSAQTYRQTGNDYWPGPLDGTTDSLTYATSQDWAKIWKVNRSDIESFLLTPVHTTTNTPEAILTWPATGNTYATGNGGAALPIRPFPSLAPFVDVNRNGIYEPLLGDYPDIKGDQALWWIFSDNGPTHNQTRGKPMGVEVQVMAYAYNRGTLIDNVVYFDYTVINSSGNSYNNARLGIWDDIDLGWYYDDYIGFDSSHRMGIQYNGNDDDGAGGGHPINSYGTHIPIVGMSIVRQPGDSTGRYSPAGCFTYFNNDASIVGNPMVDTQYDNYLRAKIADGTHFTNDFSGPGVSTTGYGSGPYCNYVFPGDPSISTEWSECASGNPPADRRFIITSNDFRMLPGSIWHFVTALITTNPDTLNGCPTASFDSIKTYADTAWAIYNNPPGPPTAVKNVANTSGVSIYPNPALNALYIQANGITTGGEHITIYNAIGQIMNVPINKTAQKDIADISLLPPGLYNVLYSDNNMEQTMKFIKE